MKANLEKELTGLGERLGFYFGRSISYPLIPPEHAYFSLTARCNLRCRMCDISRNPSRAEDELSVSGIKDIILQIENMGIRHLIFSGGEPFLRRDFFQVLEFASASGIERIDIITNGTFLDEYAIQRLTGLRLNHISISLDGLKEANDSIRGDGIFQQAEDNIDRFIAYKRKKGLSFPTLGINFTIMDKNIDDALGMVEFARAKGLNAIFFQPVLFNNIRMYEKKTNALWPSEDNILKLKGVAEKIVSLKGTIRDFVICTDEAMLKALPGYFKGKRPETNFSCYEAIKRIAITCVGELWSCMGTYGDLKETVLEEIWFSQRAAKIREKVKGCKQHCLQDCVYFCPDILSRLERALERQDAEGGLSSKEIEKKLLERVDHYIDILEKKSADNLLPADAGFKKELRRLYLIRDRLKNSFRHCEERSDEAIPKIEIDIMQN